MFGFGRRNTWNRASSRGGGILGGGGLRRAAIAGLGMLAFRWLRNRSVRTGAAGKRPGAAW